MAYLVSTGLIVLFCVYFRLDIAIWAHAYSAYLLLAGFVLLFILLFFSFVIPALNYSKAFKLMEVITVQLLSLKSLNE